jgi:two-component system CitB family response regulator
MLTAVGDAATVRLAYARGALNYLVKPFTAEQLADRLTAYADYRADALRAAGEPCSAAAVAAELGIAGHGPALPGGPRPGRVATMTLRYGSTGRPEHRYTWAGTAPASR